MDVKKMSKKDKNKELAIIICPTFSEFPEQPSDQSKCELIDCPLCINKMWLSQKKKILFIFSENINKDIFLGCYDCFEKFAKKNKDLFNKKENIKIINI
jgi:hypothetical protein